MFEFDYSVEDIKNELGEGIVCCGRKVGLMVGLGGGRGVSGGKGEESGECPFSYKFLDHYHSRGRFSRRPIDDIFLIFPRK